MGYLKQYWGQKPKPKQMLYIRSISKTHLERLKVKECAHVPDRV